MFPLVRIVIGTLFVIFFVALVQMSASFLGKRLFTDDAPLYFATIKTLLSVALGVLGYIVFVKWVERRDVDELKTSGALTEIAQGVGVGTLLFCSVALVLWLMGFYKVTALKSPEILLLPFLAALFSGVVEELVARGIIFRIVEESLGSVLALIVSSLIFGFAHAGNPNATLVSSLAIALEAGVLLGAAYMVTRRLWLVMGLHFAWNFVQGGVFGVAVSGGKSKGLFTSTLEGPTFYTGGEFGAESSIFAVVFCLSAGVLFLFLAQKQKKFVQPFFLRSENKPNP